MTWRCVGCDYGINWDGKVTLCWTCPCGAHIFYDDESGSLAPPASLIRAIFGKTELPHLDYLVGRSNFTSPLKESIISGLIFLGAIWMKDCRQCLENGTYQRVLDREKAVIIFEATELIEGRDKGVREVEVMENPKMEELLKSQEKVVEAEKTFIEEYRKYLEQLVGTEEGRRILIDWIIGRHEWLSYLSVYKTEIPLSGSDLRMHSGSGIGINGL